MNADALQFDPGVPLAAITALSRSALRAGGLAQLGEQIVALVTQLCSCPAALFYAADGDFKTASRLLPRAAVGVPLVQLPPLGLINLERDGVREEPVVWQTPEQMAALQLPTSPQGVLLAPVTFAGKVGGLICALQLEPGQAFSPAAPPLMGLLAARVGDTLESMTAYQELEQDYELLQRRYQAMSSMYEISLELARQQRELDPMLESLGPRIVRLLDATGGGIWLWREGEQQLELVLSLQSGYATKVGTRLASGEGLVGQAYAAKQLKVRNDYTQWANRPTAFQDAPFRAAMAIPLLWQDQVVGVLVATDDREGRAFTPYDQYLAQLLASQVVIFIQNAQLFGQTQRALARTEALYRANRSVVSLTSVEETLQTVVDGVAEVLDADQVVIYTFDFAAKEVTHAVRGGQIREERNLPSFDELQHGLSGWVIANRQPAYSPKGFEDPREGREARERRKRNRTGAVIVVPLQYRGELLGTMTAFNSLDRPDFSPEDVDLMAAMASQAAAAIANAQLFAAAQRRTQLLSTGAEVSRAAYSILDVDELLPQVVALIRERFGLYYVGIFLVDAEGQWAVLRAGTGEAGARMLAAGHRLRVGGQSMIGTCVATRQARIALDVGVEAVRFDNPELPATRSEMALPLVARGEAVGAMTIQSELPRAFSEDDILMLQTMADQIATAIVNVRLFSQARQAALEAESNQILLRSIIESIPNPVFYKDIQGAHRIVNKAFAEEVLGLPPEQILGKTMLELPEAIDPEVAGSQHEADMALIREPGVQTIETRAWYADGVEHDVIFSKSTVFDAQGAVIGMVGVMNDITSRKQLLAALEYRTQQLQTAAEISRATSSILNLEELLPRAVELVRERFGYYYVGAFLIDDTGKWAVLRAGTGAAGAQMLQMGHRLLIGGQSMVGAAMQERQARIAFDVGREAVRFDNPLLPETRSEIALPLISRGDVIGALTIQSALPEAFSESDILVLETVADQIASAIANAWLFAEAQERFEELQRLQRELTGEAWAKYVRGQTVVGYAYDAARLVPLLESGLEPTDEVGQLWRQREALALADLARGEVTQQQDDQGAFVLAPITSPLGEPLGILGVDTTLETPEEGWSEEDLELLQAVREQVGMALENRLLFEQTTSVLTETTTLYEVGQKITEAHTEADIFHAVIEGLSRRPESERVSVGLFEPLDNPAQLRVVDGWAREGQAVAAGNVYPLLYWRAVYTSLEGEGAFICPNIDQESRFGPEIRGMFEHLKVRGFVAFQLRVRGMLYGTILVYTKEPHEFTPEELRFYATLTRNTSVALENLLLLETTRQEAERRALLNEVMSTASASLDPDDLVHDTTQLIAQRLEMPALYWTYRGGVLEAAAVYRFDGSALVVEEPQERFVPEDVPELTEAALSKLDYRWDFTSSPGLVSPFNVYRTALDLEELLVLPVLIRDEVLGVLVLGQQHGHPAIDENETAFLRNAAVNIGVALENAQLYQEAQETAEKLKEVDRLKSEFLANMSHELRTPLNSIIGFSRVILKGIDGPITDLQKTDLEAIYQSGRHLLELINDILDQSKIEAGKMEYTFEPTDLMEIIRGVMSTSIALVKDKPIELQQQLSETLPTIIADSRRIRQVLLNLVGNAAKFTEQGFISLSAWADEEWVTIAVQDSGVGIPKDRYDAVFTPFEQVDSSSSRRFGGTGLGLPVSKRFVEAHGGSIWFESEMGVGSTFYVKLPIAGPPAEKPAEEERPVRAPRLEGEDSKGLLVLTVDDDAGVITLFRRYLSKQGYRVVGLTRGDRVVEEAKRLKPYAITLDILMPDRSGWEVIRDLKSDPLTRDIPVIVCSIVAERDKGLSMGVADYLVKPILEQDLLSALARLSHDPSKTHVLVVDDNLDDRNLLERILADAGYTIATASDGVEAIADLALSPPDLVVLDLMMPDVDGFAVLENMKARPETRDIPVIVVTAKELSADERADLTARVQALLQKGLFDQERLLGDVAAALARLGPARQDTRR